MPARSSSLLTAKRWTAEQMAGLAGLVIAVVLIVLGAIGSVLLQPRLQDSQDLRQQAATDDGLVVVTTTAATTIVDQPSEIAFAVNTNGVQVDGVQLVFNLITPTLDNLNLTIEPGLGMHIGYSEIEQTSDGYLVGFILATDNPTQPFNSPTPVTFARLSFTPLSQDNIEVAFDQSNSLSIVHNSEPPRDELKTLTNLVIPVLHGDPGPTATPSPSPSASPTTSPTASPTASPTTQPTATPSPSPSASPTLAPTAQPTTAPVTGDDFFFPALNDKNGVFRFFELNTAKTEVAANKLIPGQNYRLELPYLLQNLLKSGSVSGNVSLQLLQNNQLLATINVPYANLRSTTAGVTGNLSTTFTAQATNNFLVLIDNFNVWAETNESNNAFEKSFSYVGVGGITYRSCNESCGSNTECGPNFRCYQNVCRLATNVSSSSCSAPPDQGLQRSCNEYCADSRECSSGYTCFFNRCRLPSNPDNTSCNALTASSQQSIVQGCNQVCDSNQDCGVNLRCYNGACRLATNPASSSCSAMTSPTISDTYNTGGKGADDGSGTTTFPSVSPRATASSRPGSTARPSATPLASADQSWMGGWQQFWDNLWTNQPGNPVATVPRLAILTGGGLLALILILFLILWVRRRRNPALVTKLPTPANTQAYEQNLQSKIEQLKQTQQAKTVTKTGLTGTASATPMATANPVTSPAAPVTPVMSSAPSTSVASPTPPSSSLVARLRSKGVTPPGQLPKST
jgi:hypothetical protein